MSLWADYHKETEGHDCIETEDGFIRYSFSPPLCVIHDIYVRPLARKLRIASRLTDEVAAKAKAAGMTHLWSKVWLGSMTAGTALKGNLGYGFRATGAEDNFILMMKEI